MWKREPLSPLNHLPVLAIETNIKLNHLYKMKKLGELSMPITNNELNQLKEIGKQMRAGIRKRS